MSLASNIADVVTQIGVKLKALTGRVATLEAGGAGAGPMNSAIATGTAGTLGTTEAQIASVTVNVTNASSKVLLIARASLTKDTGTTVRTATLRVRAGTTNTDTQVGKDGVMSSSAVASSAYNGVIVVMGEHLPGATGNITYSLRGLVGAGASTVSNYELEAIELTGAKGSKGDKGDVGAPITGATEIKVVTTMPGSPDPNTVYIVTT